VPIILALGSNIGNRKRNIDEAIEKISSFAEVISISKLYESEALLKDNSPEEWNKSFYNNAICITTNLNPLELLQSVKNIELKMKRDQNAEIWSPRVIDIDIILYNDEIINTEDLTIPHKEIANRLFVLHPLNDLITDYIMPSYNTSVNELLSDRLKIENLRIWQVEGIEK